MHSRTVLTGLRGWSVVGLLSAALVGTVAVQLPASADGSAAAPPVTVPTAAAAARTAAPAASAAGAARPTAVPAGPAREARLAGEQARVDAARVARAAAVRAAEVRAAEVRAAEVRAAEVRADAAAAQVRADAARAAARAASAPAAPAAAAPAAGTCDGSGWQQRRGAAALASLRPAPSAASAVRFRPARSGYLGLTHLDSRLVEVFVRSCAQQSDALLRHVVAHELGHAFDEAHLSPALREVWMRARGIPPGTPWYGCDRCTDFATPAGDFAETYAQWRRGASSNRSRMAAAPGPAALQALAARFFTA